MSSNSDSKKQFDDSNNKLIDPQFFTQKEPVKEKENVEYKNVVFLGKKTLSPIDEKIILPYSTQKKCMECSILCNKQDIHECKNCHNFFCKNCISKNKEIEIDNDNFCICKECKEKIVILKCSICGIQNKNEKAYNFYKISKEQKESFKTELKKININFLENGDNKDDDDLFKIQICHNCNNIYSDLIKNIINNNKLKEEKTKIKENIIDKMTNLYSKEKTETNIYNILDNMPLNTNNINSNVKSDNKIIHENYQNNLNNSYNNINYSLLNKNNNLNLYDNKKFVTDFSPTSNNNFPGNNNKLNPKIGIPNFINNQPTINFSMANNLIPNLSNNYNDMQNLNTMVTGITNNPTNNKTIQDNYTDQLNLSTLQNNINNMNNMNNINNINNANETKFQFPMFVNNQMNFTNSNMVGNCFDVGEIKDTFNRVTKNLADFDNNNIQKNLNILSNIEKVTTYLSRIINDQQNYTNNEKNEDNKEAKNESELQLIINNSNNENDDIKNKNEEKNDSNENNNINNNNNNNHLLEKMNYLFLINEETKQNLKSMKFYNEIQKFFLNLIFQNVELFLNKLIIENNNKQSQNTPIQNIQNVTPPPQPIQDPLKPINEQYIRKTNLSMMNNPHQIQFNTINSHLQPRNPNNIKIDTTPQLINQPIYNYNNAILTPNSQQIFNNANLPRTPNMFQTQSFKQDFPQNMQNVFGNIQPQHQKLAICNPKQQGINFVIYPVFGQNVPQVPPLLNHLNGNGNEGMGTINNSMCNNISNLQYDNNNVSNGNIKM